MRANKKLQIQAAGLSIISEIISHGVKGLDSFTWMQHFGGMQLTGNTGTTFEGGAMADEKTNKLTEPTDNNIKRRADLFKGIYSSFFG